MVKGGATLGNLVVLCMRRGFHRKEGSVFLDSYFFVNGTLARELFCSVLPGLCQQQSCHTGGLIYSGFPIYYDR